MDERQWEGLSAEEKIQKLYESVQTLAVQNDALKHAYKAQAAKIEELEDRLRTLESHMP